MSQLFTSSGQNIGVSASASAPPMNTQDLSPSGWTGWIFLQSKGLSRVFSSTTVQKHQFFGAQLSSQSNSHIHLLLGPYHLCPLLSPFCMKCSLGISNFLEEISSLSHSIVFLCFFALIAEEGFLISPDYSLELCIQMGISFLSSFAFCFSSFHSYFCKASSDSHFAFLHCFSMGMVLIPVSCTMSQTSIHSSSGTLSIRSIPFNLFLTSTI